MRYFIVTDEEGNIKKMAVSGDDEKINVDMAEMTANDHVTVQEVDVSAFDLAVLNVAPTPEASAWAQAKASGTDAALAYIAKTLGLE